MASSIGQAFWRKAKGGIVTSSQTRLSYVNISDSFSEAIMRQSLHLSIRYGNLEVIRVYKRSTTCVFRRCSSGHCHGSQISRFSTNTPTRLPNRDVDTRPGCFPGRRPPPLAIMTALVYQRQGRTDPTHTLLQDPFAATDERILGTGLRHLWSNLVWITNTSPRGPYI